MTTDTIDVYNAIKLGAATERAKIIIECKQIQEDYYEPHKYEGIGFYAIQKIIEAIEKMS